MYGARFRWYRSNGKTPTVSQSVLSDIEDEASIKLLVDTFYQKVREDGLIGPVFDQAVQDWDKHMPTMYAFWTHLLFRRGEYSGNPWAKHAPLDVEKEHFQRWLILFRETVSELFDGPVSQQALAAAQSIAHSFQIRKGINPYPND